MCWYLFRVTPFTSTEINKIRAVVSKYINQSIFPRIKWSTLTLLKKEGGLNILDPLIQQSALFFRWIRPLLQEEDPPDSKVLNFLKIHIQNNFHSTHHAIPLLFQEGRRRPPIRLYNTCSLIVNSIDRIPRDFSYMTMAFQTCLRLPIQAVFVPTETTFKFPSICRQMKVQDLFCFHSDLGYLQRYTLEDIQPQFRRATNKLFRAVEQGALLITQFFGKHCLPPTETPNNDEFRSTNQFTPFVACLTFPLPPNKSFEDVNTKIFRQTCARKNPLPNMLSHIRPLHWLAFWSLNLTAIQRNIVFRLIHLKIPHKALLHRLLPDKVESSQCSIFLIHEDSLEHFFFDCPSKSAIWQSIIREFLWPTVNTQDIHSALKTLNFDSITYCSNTQIPAKLVLIITLANIWKAHWYTIFNQTSFEPTQVIKQIHSDIHTRIAENTDLD